LSDTAAYDGETLASLGLTPGSYVYRFGSGATADTFTVDARVIPEPSTWVMLLVGFGGLAFAGWRSGRAAALDVV
jgi:PEP-CTERM motif-containing protein